MADESDRPQLGDTDAGRMLKRSVPSSESTPEADDRTPVRDMIRDLATGGAAGLVRNVGRDMRKRRTTR